MNLGSDGLKVGWCEKGERDQMGCCFVFFFLMSQLCSSTEYDPALVFRLVLSALAMEHRHLTLIVHETFGMHSVPLLMVVNALHDWHH